MKKSHIIALVIIAIAVGVIIANTGDYTTYANFKQAQSEPESAVNVAGYLAKDKPLIYDPMKDPNYFEFTMYDRDGNVQEVIYKGSKPQDFERSEQLVVKGKMEGSNFRASEILMKCPSKYVNDEITLKEVKAKA
jgi:cytochrome c-type biogenesis protein CcmE